MSDRIILFDGSRKMHRDIAGDALDEIERVRQVGMDREYIECPDLVDEYVVAALNKGRGQVETGRLLNLFSGLENVYGKDCGKIILLDNDLYTGNMNFCYGVSTVSSPDDLGFVIVSTDRLETDNQTKDLLRHELGHMFGAPKEGRSNTYESYGEHCSNDLCVMDQKLVHSEAVRYTEERARAGAPVYCGQCENDIRRFGR